MAGTLQSLGRIGQDPQMANRIVQALIESAMGQSLPIDRMDSFPPTSARYQRRRQPQLMSPQDLPDVDRHGLARDAFFGAGEDAVRAEMVGGPGSIKSGIGLSRSPVLERLAKAAGKVRARLTGAEGAYFDDLTRADSKELKKLVPSVRSFGSQRDKTGKFDEVAATLEVAEKDLPGLLKYLESTWLSESRAVGGPGTRTLPRTFSRPELLLDRFRPK